MPEEAVIETPPAQSTPTPEPEVGGISEFTQSLADSIKTTSQPKPEAKAAEAEKPAETAKAETVKEVQQEPVKPSKEKPLAEMSGEELDALMKKAPSKAWKVYEFYKTKSEAKMAELEARVKAIGEKPVETAADAKKVEAYEKQIKELQEQNSSHLKTLAELDYSKSPEFRERFTEPLTRAYQAAVEEITQLTVAEGETTRQATQHDFDLLMRLPLKEQITRAKAMFGDMADVFFSRRSEIQRIQAEGRQALEKAQKDSEGNRLKAEARSREEQATYDSQLEIESKDLASRFPEMFGDAESPEISAIQSKARDFARKALAERASMSPQERAAHDAALIETHAYSRRAVLENLALQSKVETLTKELEKYRKTDPGADTTGKPKPAAAADEIGGIDEITKVYKPVGAY